MKRGIPEIRVSNHALERFQERWPGGDRLKNPEKALAKILKSPMQEIWKKPRSNMNAFLKYGKSARYFRREGWIFVTSEDLGVLLTVERWKDCPYMWQIKRRSKR